MHLLINLPNPELQNMELLPFHTKGFQTGSNENGHVSSGSTVDASALIEEARTSFSSIFGKLNYSNVLKTRFSTAKNQF